MQIFNPNLTQDEKLDADDRINGRKIGSTKKVVNKTQKKVRKVKEKQTSQAGLGSTIKRYRKLNGLTQEQFGSLLNPSVNATIISRWERGKTKIPIVRQGTILEILGSKNKKNNTTNEAISGEVIYDPGLSVEQLRDRVAGMEFMISQQMLSESQWPKYRQYKSLLKMLTSKKSSQEPDSVQSR